MTDVLPRQQNHPAAGHVVLAITRPGSELARKIASQFQPAGGLQLWLPEKFALPQDQQNGVRFFSGSIKEVLPQVFESSRGIIATFSLGALIRLLAPFLQDKKTDPAVVVVDEAGQFVISVLSGHLGGANQLARDLAAALGATPVITTASDVHKTLAVDLLGREFGWQSEQTENMTRISAAVVNSEKVAIIQESGEKNWWAGPLPANIFLFADLANARASQPAEYIFISHRQPSVAEMQILQRAVIFRPPVLVLGIGCNRHTPASEIEAVIASTLAGLGLSLASVKKVCTIDLKKDEPGLLEVCRHQQWPLQTFSSAELNQIKVAEPSETVYKYTGAWAVSEPAAILGSEHGQLLLPKIKSGNVTISVALANQASKAGAVG